MNKYLFLIVGITLILTLPSCDLEGVEKETTNNDHSNDKGLFQNDTLTSNRDSIKEIEKEPEIAFDTLRLDSGIEITYFKKGEGEKLNRGEVIKIDYRARLEDGKTYDGNHLVKKPWMPFLVGWNQQTEGWDLAMEVLRIGDDVDVFIPAKYARGEEGIEGIVPPNSNTIISMRILDKLTPKTTASGVKIWKYDEFSEPGPRIEEGDKININYFVSSESNPRYDNSYQRGHSTELVMGDQNIVPGLHEALLTQREGNRVMIMIPASQGYGTQGYVDFVKPNEAIFYDIQIANVEKKRSADKESEEEVID